MKGTGIFLAAILISTSLPYVAEPQERKDQTIRQEVDKPAQSAELFVRYMGPEHGKRIKLLGSKFMGIAISSLADRSGRRVDDPYFLISVAPGVMGFACTSNIFWKEDVFQEDVFSSYIARIQRVPRASELEWTASLAKVNRGELQMMYNLGAIILQDRLFGPMGFRQEESAKLLKRLASIPQEVIEVWADTRQMERYQAAVTLCGNDLLFSQGAFQPNVFTKILTSSDPSVLLAVKIGDQDLVKSLLASGKTTELRDDYDRTPLIVAADRGHKAIVEALLANGANVNAKDSRGRTALSYAAEKGNTAIAQLLLDGGADVNIKGDQLGGTPLIEAAVKGDSVLVKALLGKGADVNASSDYRGTALIAAAKGGHSAIVQLLLDGGADPNAKGGYNETALMGAAGVGKSDIVEALLAKGSEVNAKSNTGMTALMYAAMWGRNEIVKILLSKGADINSKDNKGKTALKLAEKEKHTSVISLLKEAGKKK